MNNALEFGYGYRGYFGPSVSDVDLYYRAKVLYIQASAALILIFLFKKI